MFKQSQIIFISNPTIICMIQSQLLCQMSFFFFFYWNLLALQILVDTRFLFYYFMIYVLKGYAIITYLYVYLVKDWNILNIVKYSHLFSQIVLYVCLPIKPWKCNYCNPNLYYHSLKFSWSFNKLSLYSSYYLTHLTDPST